MNAPWLNHLADSLKANNKKYRLWDAAHGQLLVTIDGARVLACRIDGVDHNLFWHHPDMEQPKNALGEYEILGGDRLWIAPEAGLIFTDRIKAQTQPVKYAELPPDMDPGHWKPTEDSSGHLSLKTRMKLRDHKVKGHLTIQVQRRFDRIDAPANLPPKIKCVSFSISHTLTMLTGDRQTHAGIWSVLQMPATGWIILPTIGTVARVRRYYAPFGPNHLKIAPGQVRFLVDGERRIKMGLKAEQLAGRMGYYRPLDAKRASLIVRCFAPQPGQPYADVPLTQADTLGGDTFQAYNHHAKGIVGERFGEMEYHDPAVIQGVGPQSRSNSCVTHVMVGTIRDIQAAGRMLLGVDL